MYTQIANILKSNQSVLLFTDIGPASKGKLSFFENGVMHGDSLPFSPEQFTECNLPVVYEDYFIERIVSAPFLIILGGGHVAVQLAKVANIIGFKTVVVDERDEFANKERFPEALSIINKPFNEALPCLDFPNAYYVIVTRGHQDDRQCLESILKKDFTYCGMIGSRKKVKLVFEKLLEAGFSSELISRVHSPIGLDIGANTPEEIAISIAAELISVKNNSAQGTVWDDSLINAILSAESPYAMVTLISKKGSSPRSPGARMIVLRDGTVISSIGGGYGEYEACMHAQAMMNSGETFQRYTCHMTNDDAARKGMICGGTVDVIIKIV